MEKIEIFCSSTFYSELISPMSEGFQVSKVTICAKILKWQPVSDLISKCRYRAAMAAKKGVWFLYLETPPRLDGEDHLGKHDEEAKG